MGQRGREAGKLFDRPTDIAWLPDGTFFITDGYGGTRVAKFDPDGNFLMEWGQPPADPNNPGPNEWNTVHSIAISDDRRLFVMDRNHRRMQVFDENGKFLELWSLDDPGGFEARPYTHIITTDQHIWVGEGGTNRILKYDLNGRYLYGWGAPGSEQGLFNGPHAITVDQDGNFYVAEVFGGRVQKFRPKPNADPAKMVGQELRYGGVTTQ
jgi:DNA-binding beta-propeller fold protein YncE